MELIKELKERNFPVISTTPTVHCKTFEDNSGARTWHFAKDATLHEAYQHLLSPLSREYPKRSHRHTAHKYKVTDGGYTHQELATKLICSTSQVYVQALIHFFQTAKESVVVDMKSPR
ncbi:hypothetical protein THAOC_02393 [Thalassiosira oceanica]|uniref:Uncharacterized protein n=1 Tax=Thalassiosira oceanica TaxID=159749 RepID=K0TM45_THAOC|nr:hypothetical protein THAOC_02393 [Thalassiosira oceanica]|eukprot:EJK75876.1 hypothetical protein THAOC_02393 [Thalassiosira oceanica]